MRITLFLCVCCLLGISCGNGNKVKIPEGIISRDSMVSVLTDIHLAKAAQQMGMLMNGADTAQATPYDYVWKKHHITQKEYTQSLDFYTHHPALLDSVYEYVLNNLSKERAELLAKRGIKKK